MEEINNKEAQLEKELIDTKSYLDIVIQELEELKLDQVSQFSGAPLEKQKKSQQLWNTIVIIESCFLLTAMIILVA